MADEMLVIDASALESIDYAQYLKDYFSTVGTVAGQTTYYGGEYSANVFGYNSGSQFGVRYNATTNDKQVLMEGANIQYDGVDGVHHGAYSGDIDSITFGTYDGDTTYTQVADNGPRSELTGVIDGLVVSNLDISTPLNTLAGPGNVVKTMMDTLKNAPVGTDGVQANIQKLYDVFAAKAQHFIGTAGDDTYAGTAFGDLIEAGAGADTMAGGAGDDIYVIDDAGDVVTELEGEGTDTIQTGLNHYLIPANVENLTQTGTANLFSYGNGLDNVLTGNSGASTLFGQGGNDTLDGGAGDDSLIGGAGDDTYIIDSRNDVMVEDVDGGTDTIKTAISHYQIRENIENIVQTGTAGQFSYGNALNNTMTTVNDGGYLYGMEGTDTLIGGAGNDGLDGGSEADVMTGGLGNDTYGVDSLADVVNELDGEGTDEVTTSLDGYTLGNFLENLTLLGTEEEDQPDADLSGTGNALNNTIVGNGGANTLLGLAGTDTLYGGEGNDAIDGGADADAMIGGAGDDSYTVDAKGDTVTEIDGEGADTVSASVNHTLANFVEKLILTGNAVTGKGNALDNAITGNAGDNKLYGFDGADVIKGGQGEDRLYGGLGIDTLSGGGSTDIFFFKTGETAAGKKNADTITDFRLGQGDQINLTGLDANEGKKGIQDFDFIGNDAFSGHTGELRVEKVGKETYVTGDTDGNGKADFTIHLDGALNLTEEFFML